MEPKTGNVQRAVRRSGHLAPSSGDHETPTVHAVITGCGVGMGYLDTDLQFTEGNNVLARAFGLEQIGGRALADLGSTGARTESLVRRVLATGRPVTVDALRARVSYYRVLDREGRPLGVAAVAIADSRDLRDRAQLRLAAETDGLTQLVNHRVFQERLQKEFSRARRHGRALSLALVDVDGFKQLNDMFGHQFGDATLQRVAGHLVAAVRTDDTVARVGGDEFALLLPETSAEAAEIVIARAHGAIRREAVTGAAGGSTVSVGICDLEDASSTDELLQFADGALYWAKANGRDAVCRYSSELVEDLSKEQRGERLLRNKALAGIRALARAIDAKDHSTLLHSERVASLAARLAGASGWSSLRVAALRETALIHDVGKIGVPLEVLLKPGALTPAEYDLVKTHALLGAVIAAEVLSDEQTSWLRGHHERWDGTGYPDNLAGDQIPAGALLLAVADAWDVMTSERVYSHAMSVSEALAECLRCAGTHFSAEVVSILARPGFERVLRIFANEQATRDRNEARLVGDNAGVFHLQCECGLAACEGTIEILADDYRAVRLTEHRYIVQVGHEIPEVETTLLQTCDYLIVEKT